MSPDDIRRQKDRSQPKNDLKGTLQGVLDRLREGMDNLAGSLNPNNQRPVPVPIPVRRPRK